jgi:hypothetical protein
VPDDNTTAPAPQLQLLETGPAGYCDPVTGMCALPGTTDGPVPDGGEPPAPEPGGSAVCLSP